MKKLLMSLLIIGTCLGLHADPFPQQTEPSAFVASNGKIKRDSNGDRV